MGRGKMSLLIRKHEIFDKKPDYLNLLFMRILIYLYLDERIYISACRYWDNDRLYIDIRFLIWNIHLSWDPFDNFRQNIKYPDWHWIGLRNIPSWLIKKVFCRTGWHFININPKEPLMPAKYPKYFYIQCPHCKKRIMTYRGNQGE